MNGTYEGRAICQTRGDKEDIPAGRMIAVSKGRAVRAITRMQRRIRIISEKSGKKRGDRNDQIPAGFSLTERGGDRTNLRGGGRNE